MAGCKPKDGTGGRCERPESTRGFAGLVEASFEEEVVDDVTSRAGVPWEKNIFGTMEMDGLGTVEERAKIFGGA